MTTDENTWPTSTFWPEPPKDVALWKIWTGAAAATAVLVGAPVAAALLGAPTASAQGTSGAEHGIVTSLGSLDQPICGMVGGQLSDGFNFITGGDFAGMLRYDMNNKIPVQLDFTAVSMPANCAALPGGAINNPATRSVTLLVVTGIS